MFVTLTLADLERTIRKLTAERDATHAKMIGEDGLPVISPLSGEWSILSAHYDEVAGMLMAAYIDLVRREREGQWDVAKPATQERLHDA